MAPRRINVRRSKFRVFIFVRSFSAGGGDQH
jgi:hypothetical protein